MGDFIFVQPNGTGGFPADNATYTFDFNNPVDNLTFLTGGINNSDIAIYEAFFQGVSVPITAANFSNLTNGVVNQNGNELFNATGVGGVDVEDNTAVLTFTQPVDQVIVTTGKASGSNANVTLGFAAFAGEEITNPGSSCLLYTSPSPRDQRGSRMPSSA